MLKHENRIKQIFKDKFDDLSRSLEALAFYKSNLEAKLNFPVRIIVLQYEYA
jgi:hypothetical protein